MGYSRRLAESLDEGALPSGDVELPADIGWQGMSASVCPDEAVAVVVVDAEAIDDGHAAGEIAGGFDFDEMFAGIEAQGRIEKDGHGDWIGKRDALFPGLDLVGGRAGAVAVDREVREGRVEGEDLGDVGWIDGGIIARKLPADKLDGQARAEDDAGGFGVDPDVEFSGGGDVAFAARGPAHDDATAYVADDAWVALEGQGEIGEGAQGDDFDAGVGNDCGDDGVDGVYRVGGTMMRDVAMVAESVGSVKPLRGFQGACERLRGARVNGDVRAAEFDGAEGVAGALIHGDVASDDGDGDDFYERGTERHDEGDCVVGGGVGVDENLAALRSHAFNPDMRRSEV